VARVRPPIGDAEPDIASGPPAPWPASCGAMRPRLSWACRERERALTKCYDMRVQTHRVGFYSRKLIEAITPKLAQSFRVEEAKNGEMTLTGTAKTAGLIRIQGRPQTRAGITPT
jgi:hypothetical protein